ncbi:insulinase family protein [Treponema sp. OMZ 787]|uniref:insulinase family protein n=1 Tax=Treponema sp. OMZ 787 TaxID=2563669 RepID=UPI0020A5C4A2|nr:insulinase family protein [Treponema sp. OMZ 787]UTC61286.1 insulinase family protein [Treponema sp. OMZ 787]
MSNLIHGFEIISKNPLPEFNAVGVYARHKKTGLELYHVLNDDDENLFSYNFMTSSPNSTGVAHIIEHTVLCGSKNYPLKDPFMVLAKQSVNTFLNAMTYPDKTVYPASSVVEADYFNLMSVYGDAVFFPNLDEWAFKQEGHRFELDENGKMSVQGVVLNEMRANYSDFDGVMYDWAASSICQGSIYAEDSGGSPLEIPDLTYEEYKAFHKKYYHPVNCRIFLMGNIPTEKQMKFLEEKFLCKFEAAEKPPFVPPIEPYAEPRFFSVPAPSGGPNTAEEEAALKDAVMLNWLLPETSDTEKLMQAYLIGEVLIGHSGAYLNKVLLESGIGEDLYPYNGIGKSLRNITLTIGMKGIEKGKHEDFKKLVFEALEELVKKGIDPKEIETAVHAIDFSNREIRRNYGPFGINLMERAMAGWTYGVSPEKTLQYTPVFEKVKKDLASDKRYVEKLIEKYLIKNKHHALVRVYPDADFCKRLDESLEKRAENFNAGLTDEDRRSMLKEQEKMNEFKQKSDSPEMLALIPHLSKKDLPPLPPPSPEELALIGKVPLVMHEQPTNGIGYFQLAFPVDALNEEDYKYLPLLSSCITGMGTDKLSWSEVSSTLANLMGGFSASAAVFTANKNLSLRKNTDKLRLSDIAGRDWLFLSGKILGELIPEAVSFVLHFLNEISFDDTKRLNDLVTQRKNDFESLLALDGNSLALLRANAPLSEKNARREMLSGLTQLNFLRNLYAKIKGDNSENAVSENGNSELDKLSKKLASIYKSIMSSGLIIELTGTKENLASLKTALEKNLKDFKAPDEADKIVFENPFKFNRTEKTRLELIPASLQVGFAVSVFKSAQFGSKAQASESILCKWLSSGPMWEKIRSIGGAYGAFTVPMSLEELLAFVSYRDPNPINSLLEFLNSIDQTLSEDFSEEQIEKLITGRYSREIIPLTPAAKGAAAFRDLLSGISYSEKKEMVEKMLQTTADDLRSCAKKLSAQKASLSSVVLASDTALSQKEAVKEFYPSPILSEKV